MEALIHFFHYSPSIATIGTQENLVKHAAQTKILLFQWVADKIEKLRDAEKITLRKARCCEDHFRKKRDYRIFLV